MNIIKQLFEQIVKPSIPVIILIGTFIFFPTVFNSCKSFEPVIIKDNKGVMDKQRSDYYTVVKFYAESGVKDAAHIGTVYAEVKNKDDRKRKALQEKEKVAKQEKKINKCQDRFFGKEVVSKKERDQYDLYINCIAR